MSSDGESTILPMLTVPELQRGKRNLGIPSGARTPQGRLLIDTWRNLGLHRLEVVVDLNWPRRKTHCSGKPTGFQLSLHNEHPSVWRHALPYTWSALRERYPACYVPGS